MEMNFGLEGIGLITGAAGGIGKATANAFALAGCKAIVLADLDKDGAAATGQHCVIFAKKLALKTLALYVDVTDPESVQGMIDAAVKEFGRVDYFVNCAGIAHNKMAPIEDVDLNEWERIIKVNMTGTMLCNRAISKAMAQQEPLKFDGPFASRSLGRGAIVNIGSLASHSGIPEYASYCASKHGVMGITKTAAIDNMPHHIRVNSVCPAGVNTPLAAQVVSQIPSFEEYVQKSYPFKRLADPDEVANTIVFLCSPAASFINGTDIVVDSGNQLTTIHGFFGGRSESEK